MSVQVVLYEGAGSQPLEPAERGAMMRALLEKGYPVESASGPLDYETDKLTNVV